MTNWYAWAAIAFGLLEMAILVAAFLVTRRYQLTHPRAARLVTRAIVLWAVAQVIAMAGPYLQVNYTINLGATDQVHWSERLFTAGALMVLLFQWLVSALYATSLWLVAYAALAQPDRPT